MKRLVMKKIKTFLLALISLSSVYAAQVSASLVLESAQRGITKGTTANGLFSIVEERSFSGAGNYADAIFVGCSEPVFQQTDIQRSGSALFFSGVMRACYANDTGGGTTATIQFSANKDMVFNFDANIDEVFETIDPFTFQPVGSLVNSVSIRLFDTSGTIFSFSSPQTGAVSASGILAADTVYTLDLSVGGGLTAGEINNINFTASVIPVPASLILILSGFSVLLVSAKSRS